jgi:hypothetical protein
MVKEKVAHKHTTTVIHTPQQKDSWSMATSHGNKLIFGEECREESKIAKQAALGRNTKVIHTPQSKDPWSTPINYLEAGDDDGTIFG